MAAVETACSGPGCPERVININVRTLDGPSPHRVAGIALDLDPDGAREWARLLLCKADEADSA